MFIIVTCPQISNFRVKKGKVDVLFKIYFKLLEFPKKERTKSLPPLRYASSFLYLDLCIILKIYLIMLCINYYIRFR